jgi:hypothetical protein
MARAPQRRDRPRRSDRTGATGPRRRGRDLTPLFSPNGTHERAPWLSADGKRLYYGSSATGSGDLVISSRAFTNGNFGLPQSLGPVNGPSADQDPFLLSGEGATPILWGNRQAYWSGTCAPNGSPGLSTDGVLTVTTSATCTVTFPPQ